MATRPTTDRVREALFGVLGEITGSNVIDCYAGSGALGLEALSRGSVHASFVESGRDACRVIKRNAESLGLTERCTLLHRSVDGVGRAVGETRFDLVLSDPPWPICQAAAVAVLRELRGRLNPGAIVVLGHPTREVLSAAPPAGLQVWQTRSWGDSAMTLLRQASSDESTASESPMTNPSTTNLE
jgi:16S rRNA (guanine966-N2)-methyltransferase